MIQTHTSKGPISTKLGKLKFLSGQLKNDFNHPHYLFGDRNRTYLNELTFFVAYFNQVPNLIQEIKINCKKASEWFAIAYDTDIKDMYFTKRYYGGSKQAEYDDIFFVLFDDLMVYFDTNCEVVKFLFKKTDTEKVDKVISEIKKYQIKKVKHKPQISLLINSVQGIDIQSLNIKKPRLDINYNYNDDFKPVHETIMKRLSKTNDKGLVLLHGKPGTGENFVYPLPDILGEKERYLFTSQHG